MIDYVEYFFRRKWPAGFRCPRCSHYEAYTVTTRRLPLYECKSCRHQTSLTAGTVMEGSRTPLAKWATAMRLVAAPEGINAVQLAEQISVTYKTAWAILMKIRHALTDDDRKQALSGTVSVGPAYYGRTNFQFCIRHPQEHPVLIALGTPCDNRPSYLKIQCVSPHYLDLKRIKTAGVNHFLAKHVKPSANTKVLNRIQYHRSFVLPALFKQAKSWINRTFHGIGPKYLQHYWNEFCFRVNISYCNDNPMEALSRTCMRYPKHRNYTYETQLDKVLLLAI